MTVPPLLEIRNLTVSYGGGEGSVTAVHDVSLDLAPGQAIGIVGESGSGKSSIAGAILDLLGPTARVRGSIHFEQGDLARLAPRQRRAVLGRRIGSVFQDPFTALNPAMRVGRLIAEPMVEHLGMGRAEAMRRAQSLLREMGIARPEDVAQAYPHQLSGGMKQRALIAAALACEPPLLILDEPTTALDVTVEAQILELLANLRRRKRIGMLFISHNLRVVRRVCDDVVVMYAGQIVERGSAAQVLEHPAHPYAKGLLASLPPLSAGSRGDRLSSIPGQVPAIPMPEAGCVFSARCPFREPACATPQAMSIVAGGHLARCWKAAGLGGWPAPPSSETAAPTFRRGDSLVNVTGLEKSFQARSGLAAWRLSLAGGRLRLIRAAGRVAAVDGVSLSISPGEVLGLVGESGCGKSTLGRLVLRLISQSAGGAEFDGADVGAMAAPALQRFRREAQLVFQNVGSSLNPRHSIGEALRRPLALFDLYPAEDRARRVDELLTMVRLPTSYAKRFPHQLSGGERQRVAIARALATNPRFIVCDEPVSALDVSVQAAIVNLLADLRDQFGLAYLFISHDLAVVGQISDRIAVMYRGRIVETGSAAEVLQPPYHPYTRALLAAVAHEESPAETGDSGNADEGGGCAFRARCPYRMPLCGERRPDLRPIGDGHAIACHLEALPMSLTPSVASGAGICYLRQADASGTTL
jgi:peptide/nickel transport system ATP-binding protein